VRGSLTLSVCLESSNHHFLIVIGIPQNTWQLEIHKKGRDSLCHVKVLDSRPLTAPDLHPRNMLPMVLIFAMRMLPLSQRSSPSSAPSYSNLRKPMLRTFARILHSEQSLRECAQLSALTLSQAALVLVRRTEEAVCGLSCWVEQ
jgi:hypothetical protein